jgi:hypothetical protein
VESFKDNDWWLCSWEIGGERIGDMEDKMIKFKILFKDKHNKRISP